MADPGRLRPLHIGESVFLSDCHCVHGSLDISVMFCARRGVILVALGKVQRSRGLFLLISRLCCLHE